jgi:hypothetical protein
MSILPKDDKARKGLPLLKQIGYFPKALREITKVSVVNNVRYNPDRDPFDINWARGKSTDQTGSGFRHIFEHEFGGVVFDDVSAEIAKVTGIDKVYVLAEAAWRALAALELEIEKVESAVPVTAPKKEPGYDGEGPQKTIYRPGFKCVYSGGFFDGANASEYRQPSFEHDFTHGVCNRCGIANTPNADPYVKPGHTYAEREDVLRRQGY